MEKFSKYIPIILAICFVAYVFIYNDYVESTRENLETKIEVLEEENNQLKEKNDELNSEIEEFEKKDSYNRELIKILQQQLEDNGLEPDEL